MTSWWLMLFIAVICPIIMIAGGIIFIKASPKKINSVYGYRTERSTADYYSWKFAHTYCGKLWLKIGTVLLPVCIIPMLFVIKKSDTVMGIVGLSLCVIGCVALVASIFPVEKALGKRFGGDDLK